MIKIFKKLSKTEEIYKKIKEFPAIQSKPLTILEQYSKKLNQLLYNRQIS